MSFRVYPRSIAVMITETFSETAWWSVGASTAFSGRDCSFAMAFATPSRVRAAGRAIGATGLSSSVVLYCIRQFLFFVALPLKHQMEIQKKKREN
ncbi:hypothetical protein [Rhodobacter sp. 24-YEA-8]|uniref:hypothetical protein n=1 Tax=Rhodobacter sp. 24-YEA-8 TaxID=1884310 RepID=UPI00115FC6A5|nr:hypothetical protein [Rhodobacter sp. 24-YEA-8]